MEVSEKDKREGLAKELADIFHRQSAIVECNATFTQNDSEAQNEASERFRKIAEEDEKNLRMIESVINSFGLRVAPNTLAIMMAENLREVFDNESASPLEQLAMYTLIKQNQMMCCHLVHKSAQVSGPDIKLALTPLDGVYAATTKQVAELTALVESYGVEWLTGEKPAAGPTGRIRDALSTLVGTVLSKTAKPSDEMNIMTVLSAEHRKVDALFAEIAQSPLEKAVPLFDQLKADLTTHSIAEEDTVYSTFKRFSDAAESMEHAHKEHFEMRSLLDEITSLAQDEEEFFDKIEVLKEKVQHHVREEESKIYSLIKKNSTEEEQVGLTKAFLAEKRTLQVNVGTDQVVASVAGKPTFDGNGFALNN